MLVKENQIWEKQTQMKYSLYKGKKYFTQSIEDLRKNTFKAKSINKTTLLAIILKRLNKTTSRICNKYLTITN